MQGRYLQVKKNFHVVGFYLMTLTTTASIKNAHFP